MALSGPDRAKLGVLVNNLSVYAVQILDTAAPDSRRDKLPREKAQ